MKVCFSDLSCLYLSFFLLLFIIFCFLSLLLFWLLAIMHCWPCMRCPRNGARGICSFVSLETSTHPHRHSHSPPHHDDHNWPDQDIFLTNWNCNFGWKFGIFVRLCCSYNDVQYNKHSLLSKSTLSPARTVYVPGSGGRLTVRNIW